MKVYLGIDKNGYLLYVASVGGGIEADINLAEYDLSGARIRAHKWDGENLTFDADKYAEIEAEREAEKEETAKPATSNSSVYDELAAAYQEGVQEA